RHFFRPFHLEQNSAFERSLVKRQYFHVLFDIGQVGPLHQSFVRIARLGMIVALNAVKYLKRDHNAAIAFVAGARLTDLAHINLSFTNRIVVLLAKLAATIHHPDWRYGRSGRRRRRRLRRVGFLNTAYGQLLSGNQLGDQWAQRAPRQRPQRG
ncbi:hypothetical protein BpHYR1_037686, partial [Brachionus plicatilis]